MAEASVRINVETQGVEGLQKIAQAFRQLRSRQPAQRPLTWRFASAALRAGGLGEEVADQAGEAISGTLRAPFRLLGGALRGGLGTFTTLLRPVTAMASATAAGGPIGIAIGVAATAAVAIVVGAAVLSFVATLKILRTSYQWAKSAADEDIRLIARTRRAFPGAVGEAFEEAKSRTAVKMNMAGALFGDAADSMMEGITRRFTESRMNRGLRGDRDIFRRLGITPQSVQLAERIQGGRLDITDWLYAFVTKREQLDTQLAAARGTPQEQRLIQQRAQFFDDSVKLFGQSFADLVGALSRDDLRRLRTNMQKIEPLGRAAAGNERASIDFKIALQSLLFTFKNLKRGIAGDVQPAISGLMDDLRWYMTDVEQGGAGMGRSIRGLLTALAKHGWEAIKILLDEVDSDSVKAFIDQVKDRFSEPGAAPRLIGWLESAIPKINTFGDILEEIVRWLRILGLAPKVTAGGRAGTTMGRSAAAKRRRAQEEAAEAGFVDRPQIGGTREGVPVFRGARSAVAQAERAGALSGRSGARAARARGGGGGGGGGGGYGDTGTTTAGPALNGNQVLDIASRNLGLNEIRDRAKLQQWMKERGYNVDPKTTAWCAAYVGATLNEAGIKGTGNLTASSYLNWGTAVSTQNAQAGDVLVSNPKGVRPGTPGAHVGIATGRTEMRGGKLYVEMLGGNQRDMVRKDFYPASQLSVRRGPQGAGGAQAPTATTAAGAEPTTTAAPSAEVPAAQQVSGRPRVIQVPSKDQRGGLTLAEYNRNPGNIKWGEDAKKYGAIGVDQQGHAIFPSVEAGSQAQASLLRRKYSGQTLRQMNARYAEDSNWSRGVMKFGGYGPNEIPDTSTPEGMARLQAAIHRQEGFRAERARPAAPGATATAAAEPVTVQAPTDDQPRRQPTTPQERQRVRDFVQQAGLRTGGQQQQVKGMLIHHTGGRYGERGAAGVAGVLRQRGLSAQYFIDREGNISRLTPEGRTAFHAGSLERAPGLSNANLEGVEIEATNDKDVNAAQQRAAAFLVGQRAAKFGYDPQKNVWGHGELTKRKESDEGRTVVQGIRSGALSTRAARENQEEQSKVLTKQEDAIKEKNEETRKKLTEEPPKPRKAIEEGTAAGDAAAKAFKDGIKDVKIPVKAPTEAEKERAKTREDRTPEKAAA